MDALRCGIHLLLKVRLWITTGTVRQFLFFGSVLFRERQRPFPATSRMYKSGFAGRKWFVAAGVDRLVRACSGSTGVGTRTPDLRIMRPPLGCRNHVSAKRVRFLCFVPGSRLGSSWNGNRGRNGPGHDQGFGLVGVGSKRGKRLGGVLDVNGTG